ncbi:hypothetical protein O181_133540 [Austropuccinia psidii MF-1]|uniref:Uncharacterized protein n=1 Tax=Austropuccinia psidii MF-1 TaxID=1389203 RepID=A0A9Q3QDL6_9BASI|nr:hypothetical protein [Austropuccinia psidii MF-1]
MPFLMEIIPCSHGQHCVILDLKKINYCFILPSNGFPMFSLQAYTKHPDPAPIDMIASHLPHQPVNLPPALHSVKIDQCCPNQAYSQSATSTATSPPTSISVSP